MHHCTPRAAKVKKRPNVLSRVLFAEATICRCPPGCTHFRVPEMTSQLGSRVALLLRGGIRLDKKGRAWHIGH